MIVAFVVCAKLRGIFELGIPISGLVTAFYSLGL